MDNERKRPTTAAPKSRAKSEAPLDRTAEIDPHWEWAERAGRREEPDRVDLGVEAAARLKLLQRAATNFAMRLPSIEEWAKFLRAEIIPVYNAVVPEARMCLECGKRMGKTRSHVCSPECASNFAARRRKPGSRAVAAAPKPEALEKTERVNLRDLIPTKKSK